MNKLPLFCFILFILGSCNKPVESEDPTKFDEKGNPIVYNEEVYIRMWTKNRNLKVTVIDTFCINQKSRALKDIKKGKLVYFSYFPDQLKKMPQILLKYGIESKEHFGRCVRIGGFEPFCYEEEMYKEINRKYGDHFIDSIRRAVVKEYVLEHPDVPYFEDGIDLREKYIPDLKKKD